MEECTVVEIKISLRTLELQARGHAGSAEAGKDLVCCAVSTLVQTLVRNMELCHVRGELLDLTEEIREGYVYIMPRPYGWSLREIVTVYRAIREGLRALAEENEDYIRLEEE